MQYDKPHLTLAEQVTKLAQRGLEVRDPAAAARFLETVGYYRASAYAYPFRELLPPNAERETTMQFRTNSFVEGARLEWVEWLWRFDRELRLLLLDAIEMVEIALRSKVGFHLGARDRFAHLSRHHLDAARTEIRPRGSDGTVFHVWLGRHLRHQESASSEDFIRHYTEKYDARLPIWVATEIMEFGQLVRLYGLMTDDDMSRVSVEMAGVSGAVLARWLKVANYVRNVSAHHARLWNRRLTYKIGRVPDNAPDLVHLNGSASQRERVYGICAVLTLLTERIRPEDAWARRFLDLMSRFPTDLPVAPETHMGFPRDWRHLDLWQAAAAS